MKPFASDAEKKERQDMIRLLSESPAEQIAAAGMDSAIEAFHRAVKRVPAYRSMVEKADVASESVTNITAFKQIVPLLNKHNTFGAHPIRDLCVDGDLQGLRSILTSSGQSGVMSFGVNTVENLANSSRSIDTGLQYIFNVDQRSTLLINALPMGVKVNSKATVVAETSVRDDMVYAIIKKFSGEFDQIIIVGEGSFIKKIVEDGKEYHNIDWPNLRVHFITGEEGIAENYRTYLGSLVGISDFDDKDEKIIMSSMGVAELDLNIFHETHDTVRIRRMAHTDPILRRALFGEDAKFCPMFFIYYPHRCLVEELPSTTAESELVISMLSQEMKIPLLRYRTGDYGKVYSYKDVVDILRTSGRDIQPELKLPFVAVTGRGKSLWTRDGALYPEAVKEALYADYRMAAMVTGSFRLTEDGGNGLIEFQLKKDKEAHANAAADFLAQFAKYSSVSPKILFHSYAAFPYGMELDWERKFTYL